MSNLQYNRGVVKKHQLETKQITVKNKSYAEKEKFNESEIELFGMQQQNVYNLIQFKCNSSNLMAVSICQMVPSFRPLPHRWQDLGSRLFN